MDEKFIRRFESYKNSLASLAEARERDMTDVTCNAQSSKF